MKDSPGTTRAKFAMVLAAILAASPVFGVGAQNLVDAERNQSPPIFARQQRDHRIMAVKEESGGSPVLHVYLTLTDYEAPLSFSLGWFVPSREGDDRILVDEFGESIPLPGMKPEKAGFSRADLHAVRGFDYISDGNLKAAAAEFQAAVKDDPASARVRNNLGAALVAGGEYGKGQAELDQAIKQKPDYALAYANRAHLALLLDQPELAVRDASSALELQKTLKPAIVALAHAYVRSGKMKEAKALVDTAYERWAHDPQVCILDGDLRLASGDLATARQRYQKACLVMPSNVSLLLKLAQVAERAGDLDEAIKRARTATQADPKNAAGHLALGRYLEANRDLRAAEIQYERALDLSPRGEERIAVFGPMLRILMTMNKQQQADKLSKSWVKENESSAACHYNRAWVASQLPGAENKKAAIEHYRKALALDSALGQAHYNLALLLVNRGQVAEAVRQLTAFIEKMPNDPDVPQAKQLLAKLKP